MTRLTRRTFLQGSGSFALAALAPSAPRGPWYDEVRVAVVGLRGRGNDLYRIREYMPEDSARHVDWKATARTGALKVREFSREDERKLRIVFDNPQPGVLDPALYERAVHLAASLGWHFHHEDVEISYVAPGLEPTSDVFAFLHYLALVEPQEATSVFDRLRLSSDYNLIITTRDRSQVPPNLASRSYVVSLAVPLDSTRTAVPGAQS